MSSKTTEEQRHGMTDEEATGYMVRITDIEAERDALATVLRNLMAKYKVRSEANIVHYDIGALAAPEWREAVQVVAKLDGD